MKKELSGQEKNYFNYFEWRYEWYVKILKSLEDLDVLIDGITEAGKPEIKKQEVGFIPTLLAPLIASIVYSVISSVV